MFMFMHTCTHIRHIYFYSQIAQLVASGPLSNWLDRLDCSESAKTLDECRTQAVGEASDSCSLNSYVAVACVNSKRISLFIPSLMIILYYYFTDSLAAGIVAAIVIGVLLPLCCIVVIIITVVCCCCIGACACCASLGGGGGRRRDPAAASQNANNNYLPPQEIKVNVSTGGAEAPAPVPPPSYPQLAMGMSQQPSSGYNPYYTPAQAAPPYIQRPQQPYMSPDVKLSSAGPPGVELNQYTPAVVQAVP